MSSNGHMIRANLLYIPLINPKDLDGRTPLHLAAREGYTSLCEFLVKNIKDRNPKDRKGRTALHFAAVNGHSSAYQLIMKNADDMNPKDHDGRTPLQMALKNGHTNISALIAQQKLSKNHSNQKGSYYSAILDRFL